MLLPQRKLKLVESFTSNEGRKVRKDYKPLKMFDDVTINYYEETKGFFGIKKNSWSETFEFRRNEENVKDKPDVTSYIQTSDHLELKNQLTARINDIQALIKDGDCIISQKDYDFFKEKFPERFV